MTRLTSAAAVGDGSPTATDRPLAGHRPRERNVALGRTGLTTSNSGETDSLEGTEIYVFSYVGHIFTIGDR